MAAVIGAILMYEVVMRLKIGTFLYARPQWAKLNKESKTARNRFTVAAE